MDLTRKTAFDVLLEIERDGAYSNLALNRFAEERNIENTSFLRELVYGVLENRILLDHYLNSLIVKGIKKVKIREATILRMGLYQLMFMDSVPDYAAINESVNLAKKLCRGREGFINGVLRGYIKKKNLIELPSKEDNFEEYLSVRYSFPRWIIDMWKAQYGSSLCEEILKASNQRPPLSIRVNTLKTDRETLKRILEERGFEVREGTLSDRILHVKGSGLLSMEEYKDGIFSVQDEASVMAAEMLNAKSGDLVIDVCAAPGGKTAAIAEIMENKGAVRAFDIYEHKLEIIRNQAKRLGITIITPQLTDGRTGAGSLNGKADKVLVDAPCSGLGVIRRKPEIKYTEEEDLSQLICIQREILERAAEYVKPGGTMVYSTCTINKEENHNQAQRFLRGHGEFELAEEKQFLPVDGTDGFFICKMIKRG